METVETKGFFGGKGSSMGAGRNTQKVLNGISAKFESGKTTFLSLLSALDKLQDGDIKYNSPCVAASSAKSKQRLLTQNDIFALPLGTFYDRLPQKTYHTAGTTIARRHKVRGIAPSSPSSQNYILCPLKYTNSP